MPAVDQLALDEVAEQVYFSLEEVFGVQPEAEQSESYNKPVWRLTVPGLWWDELIWFHVFVEPVRRGARKRWGRLGAIQIRWVLFDTRQIPRLEIERVYSPLNARRAIGELHSTLELVAS